MFRNQCLTGGTEHGARRYRPDNAARHEAQNRVVSVSQEVGRSMHRIFFTIRGVGQQRHSGCARTVGVEGRKRPHRAILEDISSGLVLSFLIGRRFLDDGIWCPPTFPIPARLQLVIWSEEEGRVVVIRFSSAIQSSAARPSSKLSEDSRARARASEGLSAASRRFLVSCGCSQLCWLVRVGPATQLQLQVQTGRRGTGAVRPGQVRSGQVRSGQVRSGQVRPSGAPLTTSRRDRGCLPRD
jgi:hypothetical protein